MTDPSVTPSVPDEAAYEKPYVERTRRLRVVLVLAGAVLLLGAMASAFDSHRLQVAARGDLYGWLSTAGKMAGLAAAMLLMLQFTLSARLKPLDRAFGMDRVLRFHGKLGATAVVLACLHPFLLFAAPAEQIGPLRWSVWPEMLGAAVICILLLIAMTSLWRVFLGLRYEQWWWIHQLVFVAAVAALAHAMLLGNDMDEWYIRIPWLAVFTAYAALFVWVKVVKPMIRRRHRLSVAEVRRRNHDVTEFELALPAGRSFEHQMPGQFGFLRFLSPHVDKQMHPFTISSAPSSSAITFTIKASGDWTSTLPQLAPGDHAVVEGPFGLFSYRARTQPGRRLVMIAGGVGLTPMLSMLRTLSREEPSRPVLLIWANRKRKDIFAGEELEEIAEKMQDLRIIHILSHEEGYEGEQGFVDRSKLERWLSEEDRKAVVFLCGPPPMMDMVGEALRSLGFPRRRIFTERFSF
jgi:predicted ferric reductase